MWQRAPSHRDRAVEIDFDELPPLVFANLSSERANSTPALLTTMSILPNAFRHSSIARHVARPGYVARREQRRAHSVELLQQALGHAERMRERRLRGPTAPQSRRRCRGRWPP